MQGEGTQAAGPQMMVIPLFSGAPWIPTFKVTEPEVKLGEWEAQIKIMISGCNRASSPVHCFVYF